MASNVSDVLFQENVTITNGTALSPAIDLGNRILVGILFPAVWTAAVLTFQGSVDNTNWFELWDDGTAIIISSAAASVYVSLPISRFDGVRYLKIRSGTSGSPVNQGADRILTLLERQ